MDQTLNQEQSTTPLDTKQSQPSQQQQQQQQFYYPQIPNGYPMYNPNLYNPQQQQQVPVNNMQYPIGAIPTNVNYAYPMNYLPQYHTSAPPPSTTTRRSCRWNICGGKKMPIKKKFNVNLILQLLLLSIANLFYGLSLTFFLVFGGITCTVAFLANRKKSEVLHGVFFGLTIIELILFSFALLAAFPLWAGGVSHHSHKVERHHSQSNHHQKHFGHLQRAVASFHTFGAPFGHFSHNHQKNEENKNHYKKHKHQRHRRHHHFGFNPLVWIGYVLFISYGVLRIKSMILSVKLIKTQREEFKNKLREQFQNEQQEQNVDEENVEAN